MTSSNRLKSVVSIGLLLFLLGCVSNSQVEEGQKLCDSVGGTLSSSLHGIGSEFYRECFGYNKNGESTHYRIYYIDQRIVKMVVVNE